MSCILIDCGELGVLPPQYITALAHSSVVRHLASHRRLLSPIFLNAAEFLNLTIFPFGAVNSTNRVRVNFETMFLFEYCQTGQGTPCLARIREVVYAWFLCSTNKREWTECSRMKE